MLILYNPILTLPLGKIGRFLTASSGIPTPLSSIVNIVQFSNCFTETITRPPSLFLRRPCLTAFSTSGCRVSGGICIKGSGSGMSKTISIFSKRAVQIEAYARTNSNSFLSGTMPLRLSKSRVCLRYLDNDIMSLLASCGSVSQFSAIVDSAL